MTFAFNIFAITQITNNTLHMDNIIFLRGIIQVKEFVNQKYHSIQTRECKLHKSVIICIVMM